MNPLMWLFVVAPAAALAALLFVWVYQEQTERGEIQREQHRTERLEFDRDFAAAWNGGRVETPDGSELDKSRARLAELEAARDAGEADRCERLAALAGQLEGVIVTGTGPAHNCEDVKQ